MTFAADTARFSQPEPDVLRIDSPGQGEPLEFDFSASEDGEFVTEGNPFILRAGRENGEVFLYLSREYLSWEPLWWDTGEYIDYGDQVDLMSRPGVEDGTD